MSNATGNGKAFKGKREGWDKNTGTYTEYVWEGTKTAILGMVATAKTLAESYEISNVGSLWQISYRLAGNIQDNNESRDEIRVAAHRVHKSIYEPPFGGLTIAQLREVQEYVEDKSLTPPDTGWTSDQHKLYNLGIAGVTSYIIYQQVIIRTSTAGPNYGFVPNYSLVGSIIHPEDIGKVVKAKLPIATPNDTSDDADYAYGWLQHMPEYTLTTCNKAQFVTEWEYGLWSTFMYGDPVRVS